tara:strand:- start:59 stop:250 length:192 start_codon:yes stop_codon:yes gene_type:complete
MKDLLKRAALFVLPFIALYFVVAFIVNDINSYNWEMIDRSFVAILGLFFGIMLALMPLQEPPQ